VYAVYRHLIHPDICGVLPMSGTVCSRPSTGSKARMRGSDLSTDLVQAGVKEVDVAQLLSDKERTLEAVAGAELANQRLLKAWELRELRAFVPVTHSGRDVRTVPPTLY